MVKNLGKENPNICYRGLVVVGLAAEVWSHVEIEAEDYFFPLEPLVNYCKMSEQCSHDFVPICGQDAVGVARMFNDNCDMFELNCDEKQSEYLAVFDDK
uniref:SFRICE_015834 n=1 Tax=Spodoptera frugiperda TaxID=7108 RepID=A0A2H1WSE8_SPOFR